MLSGHAIDANRTRTARYFALPVDVGVGDDGDGAGDLCKVVAGTSERLHSLTLLDA